MTKLIRLVPNNTTSSQITLTAEAHLVDGRDLLEQQILNIEKSLIYRAGNRRPAVSKKKTTECRTKLHLKKEEFFWVIPPLIQDVYFEYHKA
jgi:hypothetical protein